MNVVSGKNDEPEVKDAKGPTRVKVRGSTTSNYPLVFSFLRKIGIDESLLREVDHIASLKKRRKFSWGRWNYQLIALMVFVSIILYFIGMQENIEDVIFIISLSGGMGAWMFLILGWFGFTEEWKLLPISGKSRTLYGVIDIHRRMGFLIVYTATFLVLPSFLTRGEWGIHIALILWFLIAGYFYVYFMFVIFFLMFVLHKVKKLTHFCSQRMQPYVEMIPIIWSCSLLLPLFFIVFFSDEKIIVQSFQYSPSWGPIYLPIMVGYEFMLDPGVSVQFSTTLLTLAFLYVAFLYANIRSEFYLAAHPPYPRKWELQSRLGKIPFENETKTNDEVTQQDLEILIVSNIRHSEALIPFQLSPGAKMFESKFELDRLKTVDYPLLIMSLCFIFPLALAIIIYLGLLNPVVFVLIMTAAWFVTFYLAEKFVLHDINWLSDAWLSVFRGIPARKEEIMRIFRDEANRRIRTYVPWVWGFHALATIVLLILLGIQNEKLPVFRFLLVNLVAIPVLTFFLARMLLIFYTLDEENQPGWNRKYDGFSPLLGLLLFGLIDIFILNILMIFTLSVIGYLYFILLNIGWSSFAIVTYVNNFSIIYPKETVKSHIVKGRVLFVVMMMATVGFLNGILFDGFYDIIGIEVKENPNAIVLSGEYVGRTLIFDSDAEIQGSVFFENCSVRFEDDLLYTYFLILPEHGTLLMRNSTLEADNCFLFVVSGNLTMENVTIRNLGGNRFQNYFIGGMFIDGNATIMNSRILDSKATVIEVSDGDLRIVNSTIKDYGKEAIEGSDSHVEVEGCLFTGGGDSNDIDLEDCTGFIANSSFPDGKWKAMWITGSNVRQSNNTVEKYRGEGFSMPFPWEWILVFSVLFFIAVMWSQRMSDMKKELLFDKYGLKDYDNKRNTQSKKAKKKRNSDDR